MENRLSEHPEHVPPGAPTEWWNPDCDHPEEMIIEPLISTGICTKCWKTVALKDIKRKDPPA